MDNKYIRIAIFLVFNFLALFIGSKLMNNGPQTVWYLQLNKAPWTPPGWLFGVAWTLIMVCFAFYMTKLTYQYTWLNKYLIGLYGVQWLLNVTWNYVFFNQHYIRTGLVVIVLLWLLMLYFSYNFYSKMNIYSLFILPYLVWMTIATSLNAYIVFNN